MIEQSLEEIELTEVGAVISIIESWYKLFDKEKVIRKSVLASIVSSVTGSTLVIVTEPPRKDY